MKNKKKIRLLIDEIYSESGQKKTRFYTSLKDEKSKIHHYKRFIFYGKNKILKAASLFFYLIYKNIKFDKNFFLIFEFDNLFIGHNIFPDWPGNYTSENYRKNFFVWLKHFSYIFVHYKKLVSISIELDNDYTNKI